MNPTTPSARPDADHAGPARVEIRVRGRLEPRWSAWFDGLDVAPDPDGTTVIQGPVVDQASLFGVLQKVRDLALPLVSVRLDPDEPAPGDPAASDPTQRSTP